MKALKKIAAFTAALLTAAAVTCPALADRECFHVMKRYILTADCVYKTAVNKITFMYPYKTILAELVFKGFKTAPYRNNPVIQIDFYSMPESFKIAYIININIYCNCF